MEFRNEEKTHKILCWIMDVALLMMAGWLIGLAVVLVQHS